MHKDTATPLTQLKERLAKMKHSGSYGTDRAVTRCYGKRCAQHMPYWDWAAAR